eukprot:1184615-Prorocentrum_minimum.AAC.1
MVKKATAVDYDARVIAWTEGVEEVDDWEDACREARDAATVQDRAQRQLTVARADARAVRIAASAERRIVPTRGVDGAVANEEDGRTTSGRCSVGPLGSISMEYTAEVPGSFPADLRDEDDTLKTYLQSIPPPPTSYEAIVFANEERGYL